MIERKRAGGGPQPVSEPPTEIVTPSPQDAQALAAVLYRASAAAYTGIVPPGFLWTLEQTVRALDAGRG